MVRFRELYGAMPSVVVPEVLLELSGKRVITSEWIDGEKVNFDAKIASYVRGCCRRTCIGRVRWLLRAFKPFETDIFVLQYFTLVLVLRGTERRRYEHEGGGGYSLSCMAVIVRP